MSVVTKRKTCSKCGIEKDIDKFRVENKQSGKTKFREVIRNECYDCEKEYNKMLQRIKKAAPKKPDRCECCGKVTEKLVVDHCHDKLRFRGWICQNCNIGIGRLGDNIEGLQNAMLYLFKTTFNEKLIAIGEEGCRELAEEVC